MDLIGEAATILSAWREHPDADACLVASRDAPAGDDGGVVVAGLEPRAQPRHAGVAGLQPRDEAVEPLTPRERQVLALLAEGLPNKAIAVRLGISDQTVKFHVASICSKLGAANRTEAVRKGLRQGLVEL